MIYRVKTGMFAWLMFRITGLTLIVYLGLHLTVVSSLQNPATFDKTMGWLGSWQFRLLEIGLFVAVLYHALNGIRILLVDFGRGALAQAKIFWILAVIGFVLLVAGGYPMLSHALHWKSVQEGRAAAAADDPLFLEGGLQPALCAAERNLPVEEDLGRAEARPPRTK